MRPIGAGTGADATEPGPQVPACSAPSGTSSRTSSSGSRGHRASAPTSTPGSFAVAEEARRTSLRSAPRTAPRLASSARWETTRSGERLTAALSAAGVDVRIERGATGSRTGTVVVLVAPDGERTMLTDRGSALDLAVVDDRWLDDVDVLHLPSYSLTAGCLARTAIELARRAKARQALLSVDASSIATLEEFGQPALPRPARRPRARRAPDEPSGGRAAGHLRSRPRRRGARGHPPWSRQCDRDRRWWPDRRSRAGLGP